MEHSDKLLAKYSVLFGRDEPEDSRELHQQRLLGLFRSSLLARSYQEVPHPNTRSRTDDIHPEMLKNQCGDVLVDSL